MSRASIASTTYEELLEAIVSGRFPAGTVLSEGRIAADLDVSRTPVRQALRRLDLEGHIERDARGRPIVHAPTGRELAEIFAARELLEGFGARLAALRISSAELDELDAIVREDWAAHQRGDVMELARLNREFHGRIMSASRNRALMELVDELQWRIFGLSAFAVGGRADSERFVSEHGRMVELLREGDPAAIERLAHEHLRHARALLGGDATSRRPARGRSGARRRPTTEAAS